MTVIHKLSIDLIKGEPPRTLDMMQYDQLSRQVEITLHCDGEVFLIPEDANALVQYLRADGVYGIYDALSDGSAAWAVSENVLTLTVAPEVLMAAGTTAVSVQLLQGSKTLTVVSFLISVHKALAGEAGASGCGLRWYLPMPENASAGQYLMIAEADENGIITALDAVDAPEFDTSFGVWGEVYAQKLRVTGSFSTDSGITVVFNGCRLQNVGAPQEDSDAATKAYVDQAIADALQQMNSL